MNKLTTFFPPKRNKIDKEQCNNDNQTMTLTGNQINSNISTNNKKRSIVHVQQQEDDADVDTNETAFKSSAATTTDIEKDSNNETNKKKQKHTTAMYTQNVQLLIESLQEVNDNDNDTNKELSWRYILHNYFLTNKSFEILANFLYKERIQYPTKIYPSPQNVWTALNICSSINKIKVIIVGQDPYHQPNQAHGLAFSVQKHIQKIPPSLLNIYKELASDTNITVSFSNTINNNRSNTKNTRPQHGHLLTWAQQGVLLLNAVLTVQYNEPNSHAKKYGWEQLTDKIIQEIVVYNTTGMSVSTDHSPKGVVFLLWGKPAYQKATTVLQSLSASSNSNKNDNNKYIKIISTSHPSPLGATKTSTPFLGSKCFSKCNEYLVQMGHTPINWNID